MELDVQAVLKEMRETIGNMAQENAILKATIAEQEKSTTNS
jgi:hypothetical protein